MNAGTGDLERRFCSLRTLAVVNAGIWAVSLVALVFVVRHSPAARGLLPILAGGAAVGISLIAVSARSEPSGRHGGRIEPGDRP